MRKMSGGKAKTKAMTTMLHSDWKKSSKKCIEKRERHES